MFQKFIKSVSVLLCLCFTLGLLVACSNEEQQEPGDLQSPAGSVDLVPGDSNEARERVILATTTSVNDSGLLSYLMEEMEEDCDIDLDVVSQGTGQAIQTGQNGDADILLIHAKESEEQFVEDGHGVERVPFMYNYFVLVGPKDDPAQIKGKTASAGEALNMIAQSGATFVSRGDDSGTHKKELALWETVGVEDPQGDYYVSVGKGMGDTLITASEMQAYTLTDKATFLAMEDQLDLEVVLEQTEDLLNQYTLIRVNPEMHPNVNAQGAQKVAEWMVSDKALKMIATYGEEEYGEPLFFINYAK